MPRLGNALRFADGTTQSTAGFVGSTGDLNTSGANAWVHTNMPDNTNNMNLLTDFSRVGAFYDGTSSGPFGSQWYSIVNMRHRGGSGDGNIWGTTLAFGMTSNTTRVAFRTQSAGTWGGWCEIPTLITFGGATDGSLAKFVGGSGLDTSLIKDDGSAIKIASPASGYSSLRFTPQGTYAAQIRSYASGVLGIDSLGSIDFNYYGGTGGVFFWRGAGFPSTMPSGIAMSILSSGRVGIGTLNPSALLEIVGSTTDSTLRLGSLEAQSYTVNNCWIASNMYFNGVNFVARTTEAASMVYFYGGQIRFRTATTTTAGSVVAFTDSFVDTSGNWSLAGNVTAGSGQLSRLWAGLPLLGAYGSGRININNFGGFYCDFYDGGVRTGSITVNGSNTAFNSTSDYRAKENVEPLDCAVTLLQRLNPVTFNFITHPDTRQKGFLAHELQDVLPEAVTGDKDAVDDAGEPILQQVDQSKLIPVLTAALQEALTRIEALENK